MTRPVGTILREPSGEGIHYAIRLSYQGKKIYVPLGHSDDGWDEQRVEDERVYIGQQIRRGEWTPPAPKRATTPGAAESGAQTLQVFASTFLARKKRHVSERGYSDLRWKLEIAVHYLGDLPIDAIDVAVIEDRLVDPLLTERDAIVAARAAGKPLMEAVTDKRGRTYLRQRRGLARGSINKVLSGLHAVLKDAKRRKLIDHNPAEDPDLRLSVEKAKRSFLEIRQIHAVLGAARLIESDRVGLTWEKVRYIRSSQKSAVALAKELHISDVTIGKVRRGLLWDGKRGPRHRNDLPHHAILAVLIMAGVRISELCGLEWRRHIDLPGGRIIITRDITKTDGGERVIPMVPALREILTLHRAERGEGGKYVFPTRNGTRNNPDNVRSTIVDAARERANELLAADGLPDIAHLTPHTLRRTFASLLAEIEISPRRAMYLMGHENPKLTLAVYQQVVDVSDGAIDVLEELLGAPLEELHAALSGRSERHSRARSPAPGDAVRTDFGQVDTKKAPATIPEEWS